MNIGKQRFSVIMKLEERRMENEDREEEEDELRQWFPTFLACDPLKKAYLGLLFTCCMDYRLLSEIIG